MGAKLMLLCPLLICSIIELLKLQHGFFPMSAKVSLFKTQMFKYRKDIRYSIPMDPNAILDFYSIMDSLLRTMGLIKLYIFFYFQMVNLKRVKGAKPGLTAPSVKLTQCSKSDEFRLVLSYYRAALSKGSSKTWDSPSSELIFHLQNPTNFISNENQLQVWQMIEQTMKDQLSTYPTTIRND